MLKYLDYTLVSKSKLRKYKKEVKKIRKELLNGSYSNDTYEFISEVYKSCKNLKGLKAFDTQLMGALGLYDGSLIEMKTGEGKTLTSIFGVSLLAKKYKQVHVVTANEYLARRDYNDYKEVYESLGFTVGLSLSHMSVYEKQNAYSCDIVYSTASEFGFDYLRDNRVYSEFEIVNKFNLSDIAVVIDEIDSILIDDARTPLIISAKNDTNLNYIISADNFVRSLTKDDVLIDEEHHSVFLTANGFDKFEKYIPNRDEATDIIMHHYISQSLLAYFIYKRDIDFVLKKTVEGIEVAIVDSNTGRIMSGRRFSNGLHQAIEARYRFEGVEVKPNNTTVGTITLQMYFRKYGHICGMTGTALTSYEEFKEIYNLDVVVIPTNKPYARIDLSPKYYINDTDLLNDLLPLIKSIKPDPILIGTSNLRMSEIVYKYLKDNGFGCVCLNAKQDKKENRIIKKAGYKDRLTVATNMAGRGTDIIVDEGYRLHVININLNESHRVNNQLYGRTARQGARGITHTLISFDDILYTKYGDEKFKNKVIKKFKSDISNSYNIRGKLYNKCDKHMNTLINVIESRNLHSRKHTFKYDMVVDKYRTALYNKRKSILNIFSKESLRDYLEKNKLYDNKLSHKYCYDMFLDMTKYYLLKILDEAWINFLQESEFIKNGLNYRSYGGFDVFYLYNKLLGKLYKKNLKNAQKSFLDLDFDKLIWR